MMHGKSNIKKELKTLTTVTVNVQYTYIDTVHVKLIVKLSFIHTNSCTFSYDYVSVF